MVERNGRSDSHRRRSPGDYSYAHQLADAIAAIAFVRDAAKARTYLIDTRRIVLAGHGTGGSIATITAADNPAIEALALISASDDSAEALNRHRTPGSRDA